MNKNNTAKRSKKTAKPNRAGCPKRRRRTPGIVFDFDEIWELFCRQEALCHGRRRRKSRRQSRS